MPAQKVKGTRSQPALCDNFSPEGCAVFVNIMVNAAFIPDMFIEAAFKLNKS